MANFALIGGAGYIAPRHIKAIRDTGNTISALLDPAISCDMAEELPGTRIFTEAAAFERFLRQVGPDPDTRINWISVCSPNYLHKEHITLALKWGANVICEKPVVLNPEDLNELLETEKQFDAKVYTVLQLRHHPVLLSAKRSLDAHPSKHNVSIVCVTPRKESYNRTWKGSPDRSGGIGFNIGIHLFDLATWLLGPTKTSHIYLREPTRMSGRLDLNNESIVNFYLSTNLDDRTTETPYREILIDGTSIKFDGGGDLHTKVYKEILSGSGVSLEEAGASIKLTHNLNSLALEPASSWPHSFNKGTA